MDDHPLPQLVFKIDRIQIFAFPFIYFLPCLFKNQWNFNRNKTYIKIERKFVYQKKHARMYLEMYLELGQTSRMLLFEKIVTVFSLISAPGAY